MSRGSPPWLCTFSFWIVASSWLGCINGQTTPGSPGESLRVSAARRAEKFVDSVSRYEVAPRSPTDVVLFVELAGISVDDFQRTPKEEVFVKAGGRQFEPTIVVSGDWEKTDPNGRVQEDRWVVIVVPRDVLSFTLHFGMRRPIIFNATAEITALLP